jgi:hypothetical protein
MSQEERDAIGREYHALFHALWSKAGSAHYVKADWSRLEKLSHAMMREAGIASPFGLPRPGERIAP